MQLEKVFRLPAVALTLLLAGALSAPAVVRSAEDVPPTPTPTPAGPKIQVDATEWDFGEIERKAPCVHDFILKNAGTVRLTISNAKASCGCTVPSLARKEIPPGETEPLKVTYDSNRMGAF